ncbi:MAG: polymer-forming cytoskeletal protein [Flavobacteriales bacterium]|nr:polymer-forming cytoskeletal protein [Flavobacteriales bacterium]
MARNNEADSSAINTIRTGTEIKGDINCKEDIRIDGKLFGNLKSAGKVVVGENGLIEGTIECAYATIFGDIKGTTNVNELLSLKSTANLVGDIITNKLQIEPGANFSGTCKMGAVIKGLENGQRGKNKEKTA